MLLPGVVRLCPHFWSNPALNLFLLRPNWQSNRELIVYQEAVMKRPTFDLGIEEEYQIIDPETRELRSYITGFLEGGKLILREREIKPEMFQSVVELGTPVCPTIQDARREVVAMRSAIAALAKNRGLAVAAA